MLWTFGRFGYQDAMLMDLMHEIALKLQADCNSKALADVVYAMSQMGWADARLHSLVADYAIDNIAVRGLDVRVCCKGQQPATHGGCPLQPTCCVHHRRRPYSCVSAARPCCRLLPLHHRTLTPPAWRAWRLGSRVWATTTSGCTRPSRRQPRAAWAT
jgi:hypothetical protein